MSTAKWLALGAALCLAPGAALAQADKISGNSVKIGILNDQSGVYADFGGKWSVEAARMAVAPGRAAPGRRERQPDHDQMPARNVRQRRIERPGDRGGAAGRRGGGQGRAGEDQGRRSGRQDAHLGLPSGLVRDQLDRGAVGLLRPARARRHAPLPVQHHERRHVRDPEGPEEGARLVQRHGQRQGMLALVGPHVRRLGPQARGDADPARARLVRQLSHLLARLQAGLGHRRAAGLQVGLAPGREEEHHRGLAAAANWLALHGLDTDATVLPATMGGNNPFAADLGNYVAFSKLT